MPAPRVLVTSRLPGRAVALLRTSGASLDINESDEPLSQEELEERLRGCDAAVCLLTDIVSDELLDRCPNLKMIANVAVGYDNIDIAAATRRGVLVTNTPGVLDETTADLAFGLLLSAARRISEADRFVRQGRWQRWEPDLMLGTDVHGKTLGLVGFGGIGQAMARRAGGFGMRIIYCRNTPPGTGDHASATGEPFHVTLKELLAVSDFISLHCPLNEETRHLIGSGELSSMKPSAILINTARGAIVDEAALVEALRNGVIAGAGLDVFEEEPNVPSELREMDNVVLAPHIGSATIETRSAMAELAASSVVTALAGKKPGNAVNPQVWDAIKMRRGA